MKIKFVSVENSIAEWADKKSYIEELGRPESIYTE